jgi:hypothetical protein
LLIGVCAPTLEALNKARKNGPAVSDAHRKRLCENGALESFARRSGKSPKSDGWYPCYVEGLLDDLGSDDAMANLATQESRTKQARDLAELVCNVATSADVVLSSSEGEQGT